MWSEAINGRQGGTGTETYHRIGLYVSAAEFLQTDGDIVIRRFVKSGDLANVMITMGSIDDIEENALTNKLAAIGSLVSNPLKKMYCTVTISQYEEAHEQKVRNMCDSGLIHGVSIAYQGSREQTVAALISLRKVCSSYNPQLQVGLESYPEDELQWIMEHSSSAITIINLCTHTAPNLHMRQVDFAHSRLCNIYISFDMESSEDNRYDYIRKVSEKYNRPPAVVLAKALIQLGFLVLFNASCTVAFLEREVLSLCHPFTNRHAALAPQEPKTFMVSDADIQFIIAASEVIESTDDERKTVSAPPEKRELSFPKIFGEM